MSDSLLRLELLFFPFWSLDAKGGKESIYLTVLTSFIAFIWIWLVRLLLFMSWSCGHGFKNCCGVLVGILL
jgi:hypothetical protein